MRMTCVALLKFKSDFKHWQLNENNDQEEITGLYIRTTDSNLLLWLWLALSSLVQRATLLNMKKSKAKNQNKTEQKKTTNILSFIYTSENALPYTHFEIDDVNGLSSSFTYNCDKLLFCYARSFEWLSLLSLVFFSFL